MKINGLNIRGIQKKYEKRLKKVDYKNKGKTGDSMNISRQAKQIRNLEKKLADIPDIRTEKVEELKTAIASGEYNVDSKTLARDILRTLEQE